MADNCGKNVGNQIGVSRKTNGINEKKPEPKKGTPEYERYNRAKMRSMRDSIAYNIKSSIRDIKKGRDTM